jgi:hypothetical protein
MRTGKSGCSGSNDSPSLLRVFHQGPAWARQQAAANDAASDCGRAKDDLPQHMVLVMKAFPPLKQEHF